jgi:predicted small integral membrane protein
MAWTGPTAAFFAAIAVGLAIMTASELRWPTTVRKGFLPIPTTRGDRFFVALLTSAWVHIGWLAATEAPVIIASGLSILLGVLILLKA